MPPPTRGAWYPFQLRPTRFELRGRNGATHTFAFSGSVAYGALGTHLCLLLLSDRTVPKWIIAGVVGTATILRREAMRPEL